LGSSLDMRQGAKEAIGPIEPMRREAWQGIRRWAGAAAFALTGMPLLFAQGFDPAVSHVTPFPERDTYRTYVIGDAMGDGIAVGLADALRDEKSIEFFKKTKSSSGFTRPDIQDWAAVVKETSAKEKFHVAIIVVGAADRRPIPIATDKKRPFLVGSDEWKQEYGRRVDEFLRAFRRSSAAIYWVGLPVMKAANASEDMQMINAIIREKVSVHGGKFIDTWNGFTDVNGQYSQSGPDIAGKVKPLRDGDGVHFTKDGYRKLAHFVERELRRDLAIAKAERSVPLAGAEAEQRRVNPAKAAAARAALDAGGAPASGQQVAAASATGGSVVSAGSPRLAGLPSRDTAGDAPEIVAQEQKADSTKVSFTIGGEGGSRAEAVVIDIVRPAISAQVIGHVTRNVNQLKAAPVGENVMQALPGGLVTMSSVTTVTEIAGAARRSVPVTQTPHYKVLVKGEAMQPKPGRADDFRWPRDPSLW
jgi:uncharacterized protein